jgi:hypothetical protein
VNEFLSDTCWADLDQPRTQQERHTLARRAAGAALVRRQHDRSRQVRRVNGHLHLPKLRAALEREVAETIGATCHAETANVA